jgi:hypothetical protein
MRKLAKYTLITAAVATALLAAIVLLLVILNSRDPYGGPIEPSAPH